VRRLPFLICAALFVTTLYVAPPGSGAAGAGGEVTAETCYRRLVSADSYGTIVMKRTVGDKKDTRPVLFAHWSHRTRHTCSVCHADLGISIKAGETVVTHKELDKGAVCGACHDGRRAFATTTSCERCHAYGVVDAGNPAIEKTLKDLPGDTFGNRVDWSKAVSTGAVSPKASIDDGGELTPLDLDLVLPVTKFSPHPPDVRFPHSTHTKLIKCSTCHPSIFAEKKGGNPEMSMLKFMSGKYCGTCHGRVAFPLGDCFRCHSEPEARDAGKADDSE